MNRHSTFAFILNLGLCVFLGLQLSAQNRHISIQGTLKDASGAAVVSDKPQTLIFKLYHEDSGGEYLWTETAKVQVVGGIYSHNLGSVEEFPEDIFGQTLYLGVTVEGRELTPRTELTYAPYAISVASTLKIARGGCSGQVGDIKFSILKPEDFAQENGDCWVPMDGGNISGSALAAIMGRDRPTYGGEPNKVPDMSGYFIRAHEYNDGVDPARMPSTAVGTIQNDSNKSHTHSMMDSGSHTHTVKLGHEGDDSGSGGSSDDWTQNSTNTTDITRHGGSVSSAGSHSHTINADGGIEARPKNRNFYIYIRIN